MLLDAVRDDVDTGDASTQADFSTSRCVGSACSCSRLPLSVRQTDAATVIDTHTALDQPVAFEPVHRPRQRALAQVDVPGKIVHPVAGALGVDQTVQGLELTQPDLVLLLQRLLQGSGDHPSGGRRRLTPYRARISSLRPAAVLVGCARGTGTGVPSPVDPTAR